jgi:hypothetical protein
MNINNAVLAATFGRGSSKPLRLAYVKICCLLLASGGIGIASLRAIPSMSGLVWESPWLWLVRCILAIQVAVFVTNVLFGSLSGPMSSTLRLLSTLPLAKWQLRIAFLMPTLIVTGCCLALIIPALGKLTLQSGMHPALFCCSIFIGVLSAFAFMSRTSGYISVALGIIAICTEYKLAGLSHADGQLQSLPLILLVTLIALLCCLAALSIWHIGDSRLYSKPARNVKNAGLTTMWPAKKLLRLPSFFFGLVISLSLSLVAAVICRRYHLESEPASVIVAQIIAASLASDIRSSARKNKPPEIAALRGSFAYTTSTLASGVAAAIAAISPLLWVLLAAPGADVPKIALQVLGGALLGSLVSFILVPARRDISAQLTAGLSCLALTVIPAQLTSMDDRHPALFYVCIISASAGLVYFIEHKRNAYIWRYTHGHE